MQDLSTRRLCNALLLCALVSLLNACETGSTGMRASVGSSAPEVRRAEAYYDAGRYESAARKYEKLAQRENSDSYRLRAAEAWLLSDQWQRAQRILEPVDTERLSDSERDRYSLYTADIAVKRGDPGVAIQILDETTSVPDDLAAETMRVRGTALFALGQPVEAIDILVERENLDASIVRHNHGLIWAGMQHNSTQNKVSLDTPAGTSQVTAGWLALGRVWAASQSSPFDFRENVEAWQETYPRHPANEFVVRQLLPAHREMLEYPEQIALLLPMSGRLNVAASAVREGFLAAYYEHNHGRGGPNIRFYDVDRGGAAAAYELAVAEGADIVVGPLDKASVEAVAMRAGAVPTLALNYLPDNRSGPPLFYQFGLAPEDEARQVAERALADGHSRAVALVPDDEWGQRMLTAFNEEFAQLGGSLIASERYYAVEADFTQPIRRVLELNASMNRHRRVVAATGGQLEFVPRRRGDIDFVFVATRANGGRLIPGQLKYHYAADLPVYTTSSAYQPGEAMNRELEGVYINDIPWLIDPQETALRTRDVMDQYWPDETTRFSKLHALGFDAYRLIALIYSDRTTAEQVSGMTGELAVTSDGRVHRRLDWAQVHRGTLEPLPDAQPQPIGAGGTGLN